MSVQPILFDTLRFTTKRYIFDNKDVPTFGSNVIVITNDKVAIGTTAPDPNYACTIQGNTVIRGTLDATFINTQSSNLGYLTLINNGSYPVIDIIQETNQPYILMRDSASNIVTFFDAQGNLGIGTTIAYQPLVVNGTIVTSNIEIFGSVVDSRYFQLKPLHQTFPITTPSRTTFIIQTPGYYITTPNKTDVYWNGFKLGYFSPTYRDYNVTSTYDSPTNTTTFTITLVREAKFKDIVDIILWPEPPHTLSTGKYMQSIDLSYWTNALNSVYTYQPVGVYTSNPQYPLHVNGTLYTSNLITTLFSVADLNVPQLDTTSITTNQLTTQTLAIGSTNPTLPPNTQLYIQGNLQLQNGTLSLSSNSTILFDNGTSITSSNNSITLQASSVNFTTAPLTTPPTPSLTLQTNTLRASALSIGYPTTVTPAPNDLLINGNLGIGTTVPRYALEVNGPIYLKDYLYSSSNLLYTSSQWLNYSSSPQPTAVYYLGNVGIGTTVPRAALDLHGSLTLTGNIGIGTTQPTSSLHVQGNATITGNIRSPTFTGMVSYFAAATAPPGWLECNGQSVSRTTYADLFAYIGTLYGSASPTTFNLPDLRSEFIRGWDNGRGIDIGRTFGSSQGHAMENHGHVWNYATAPLGGTTNLATVFTTATGTTLNAVGTVTGATTAAETRPRNIAMLACIKF